MSSKRKYCCVQRLTRDCNGALPFGHQQLYSCETVARAFSISTSMAQAVDFATLSLRFVHHRSGQWSGSLYTARYSTQRRTEVRWRSRRLSSRSRLVSASAGNLEQVPTASVIHRRCCLVYGRSCCAAVKLLHTWYPLPRISHHTYLPIHDLAGPSTI